MDIIGQQGFELWFLSKIQEAALGYSAKVKKIQEDSLDSTPSPLVEIQIMGGKGVKTKHCAGHCKQTFECKKFVDNAQQ